MIIRAGLLRTLWAEGRVESRSLWQKKGFHAADLVRETYPLDPPRPAFGGASLFSFPRRSGQHLVKFRRIERGISAHSTVEIGGLCSICIQRPYGHRQRGSARTVCSSDSSFRRLANQWRHTCGVLLLYRWNPNPPLSPFTKGGIKNTDPLTGGERSTIPFEKGGDRGIT